MRDELNKIEKIENYLLGKLEGEELIRFEKELNTNAELRQEVELQRLFVTGIELLSVKEELNEIHVAEYPNKNFFSGNWLKLVLLTVTVASITALYFIWANNKSIQQVKQADISIISDARVKDSSIANTSIDNNTYVAQQIKINSNASYPSSILYSENIESNYYSINPEKDTLLISNHRTTIFFPSHSFESAKGKELTEVYSLELKEASKPSQLILNDLTSTDSLFDNNAAFSAIYLNVMHGHDTLKPVKGKDIKLIKQNKEILTNSSSDSYYFKVFKDQPEKRLVFIPVDILDYEINYVRPVNEKDDYTVIAAMKKINAKIESLEYLSYDNTFVGTIPFHYRIEGCIFYSENGAELLDIYLNNTHLKLWEADSLVAVHLKNKAKADCKDYAKIMKAEEYFRWLQSQRYGRAVVIKDLLNRNYHKGELYSKLPQNRGLLRLQKFGLSEQEAKEQLDFFVHIFKYKPWLDKIKENNNTLDYYYKNEGTLTSFSSPCNTTTSAEVSVAISVKPGWNILEKNISLVNIPLRINLQPPDSNTFIKIYLVYKNSQTVAADNWLKKQTREISYSPGEGNVSVVAVGRGKQQLYYGCKDIFTDQTAENIILKPVDKEQLKQELKKLDLQNMHK